MALVPETVRDPVAAAVETIMRGPGNPEDAPEVPEDASPRRQRGDVTIDLTGGRSHFCDDGDAQRLAEAWRTAEQDPVHVTELDLSLNKISDEGAALIIDAIAARPCRLASIDLDGNDLTDATLAAVAERLLKANATAVRRIDLSSNRITDDGVGALVHNVVNGQCSTLEALLLRANAITNVGMLRLCAWLEEAECPLRALHVSGNAFTEHVLADVGAALKSNTQLTDLNLNNTMPQVTDIAALEDAVAEHPSLLKLPLAFDGKKRDGPKVNATVRRNKAELKARNDAMAQLRRAHAAEVERLRARIADLEQQLDAATASQPAAVEDKPAEEGASGSGAQEQPAAEESQPQQQAADEQPAAPSQEAQPAEEAAEEQQPAQASTEQPPAAEPQAEAAAEPAQQDAEKAPTPAETSQADPAAASGAEGDQQPAE